MFKLVADAFMLFIVARSIRFEPEKLLRAGDEVGNCVLAVCDDRRGRNGVPGRR